MERENLKLRFERNLTIWCDPPDHQGRTVGFEVGCASSRSCHIDKLSFREATISRNCHIETLPDRSGGEGSRTSNVNDGTVKTVYQSLAERSEAIEDQSSWGRTSGEVTRSEADCYNPCRSGVAEWSEANHPGRSGVAKSVGMKDEEGKVDGRINARERRTYFVKRWTSEQKKGLAVREAPTEGSELFEALKDIENHFLTAYNSGNEVTRMLEANKIQEK
ncbi:hypothetical protein LR48_Vigan01g164300 [Vigna angularis]|uniref:DUF632 domain-containing protein n=1 Tax=Phaseolus angularis TaxID=3914 RepID=A0A0L9TNR2_PHAAN|nr:hypothetical protein LR48_Vigan01g164300 [Vigna angularis]